MRAVVGVIAAALVFASCADDRQTVRIVRVVDGDTAVVATGGRDERVRIVGLNAPESVTPDRPAECYGREASVRARELLEGLTIRLTSEPLQSDRDDFGRLLRHMWLPDGRRFADVMIQEGYAWPLEVGKGHAFVAPMREAAREARAASRGLWSPETCNGQRKPAKS